MKHLFSGKSKFRTVENDTAFTRFGSLQQYLRKSKPRNKISEEVHKIIRPKNASLATAHSLCKIHTDFVHPPRYRPIIDTTCSTHYYAGQYLSEIFGTTHYQ